MGLSLSLSSQKPSILSEVCYDHWNIYLKILIKLDVKSVIRLKLVSKSWYRLLSDPCFLVSLHKTKNPKISGFIYDYQDRFKYVPIGENIESVSNLESFLAVFERRPMLVNSCNGLFHWFTSLDHHFVSNPLTNKLFYIPRPPSKLSNMVFFACGLAFDLKESIQFKLVVLMGNSESGFTSYIFNSYCTMWRKNKIRIRCNSAPYNPTQSVYLEGHLLWELKNNKFLVYNVKNRSVKLIKAPMNKGLVDKLGFTEPGCLGVVDGRLRYCRVVGSMLCLWRAKENRSVSSTRWIGDQIVNLDASLGNPIASIRANRSQALAILDDCKRVLLSIKGKIIVYGFDDGSIEEVCEVDNDGRDYIQPSMIFPMVNTLAFSDAHSVSIARIQHLLGEQGFFDQIGEQG